MRRSLLLSTALLMLPLALALGYSSGPPINHAGNPPNMNNCTACHASFPVNSGEGLLAMNADFLEYTPGETYTMEVELIDPDASRWGFELIAYDDSNSPAGTISVTDAANTQLNSGFLMHTSAGTNNGATGSNTWTFDWTAPAEGTGEVTFYVAGNAANGNFNTSGDHIYTAALSYSEMSTGVDDRTPDTMPGEWAVGSVYPNPFNNQVNVVIDAGSRSSTTVEVYDILGRQVATLWSGPLSPGQHTLSWQPTGAAGLYFLHARNANGWSQIRKLQYVK